MDLSERLRRLRKESGLSQMEAAEKLVVSRQTISRWEAGTSIPTMENLMRLSALYHVPMDAWTQEERPLDKAKEPGQAAPELAVPEPEAAPESQAEQSAPPEDAAVRSKPKFRRKERYLAFAVIFLVASLIIGGLLFFRKRSLAVKMGELEGEVVDFTDDRWEEVSFLPEG